ncbi:MAG: D-glycero-beta-D-manno-heptose-7-phosphate kinase [bacterium]|nr:D-glycero-beta-D-manno-heptose-7-phosphate kinase [bacterium]
MSQLLPRLLEGKKPRILVAGDLILDRYVWGEVDRISPEAPVQVLRWQSENEVLGGAANVAHNLSALGCEVRLLGVAGEDAEGDRLDALAREAGISARHVHRTGERPTSCKTRLIARGQHVLRVDKEGAGYLSSDAEKNLIASLPDALDGMDGVICSDYLKGVLSPGFLKAITKAASARGIRIVADPKGTDYGKYRGATALTPNLAELAQATALPVKSPAERERAAMQLLEAAAAEWILLTQGAGGMTLFGKDGTLCHEPARALDVYDVTGAGDTAAALFGLALFGGAAPEEAVRLANLGAGIVVGKVGTATLSREELEAALMGQDPGRGAKLFRATDLAARLQIERAKGRKVVFTNGCFDILHVGHIQYLQQARRLGDFLIVGLNDDASVRKLKGTGRPLIAGPQRAELLGALACVDAVVFFAEDTPLALIEAVRPDILVKGGDYTPDQVVGREAVESFGGKVEVLPFIEGFSTSSIVDTIIERYAPPREGA